MTQQDGAPLTRRALRMQAAAAACEPSTTQPPATEGAVTTTVPALRPLTRRDLRPAGAPTLSVDAERVGPSSPLADAEKAPVAEPFSARPSAATSAAATSTAATPDTDDPAARARTARPSGPEPSDRPLTRRELRLRERARALEAEAAPGPVPADVSAACRPPFTASLVLPAVAPDEPTAPVGRAATHHVVPAPRGPREARPGQHPSTRPTGTTGSRRLLAHAGRKPVAVVALSAGLLTVGVTQVHAEQGIVAQAQAAAAAALAEAERQERSDGAAADRLMAQAAAYAAAQRTQALAAAEAAVAAAHGTKEVAAPVLDAETVSQLEAAAAELAAMLEAAPAPALEAVAEQEATQADAQPAEEGDDVPVVADAELAAQDRATQPSRSISPEGREPLPASDTGPEDAGSPEAAAAPDATPAADAQEPAADAQDGVAATSATRSGGATGPTAELVDALPDLDIEVSRRIREQAAEVAALTAQVQGLADAKIAEAAAAAAAAEEARLAAEAAAQAAAAELARKVAVAKDAPNGEIPSDVLCGVGFDEGVLLRCDAAAALEELNAAYRADFGRDLDVVSSYRSYSQQVAVKRIRGGLAAPPGMSNHGYGVAVDFDGFGGLGNFSTANYRWMRANAERFGWFHPRVMRPGGGGPQEPWHWEFGTDS